MRDTTKTVNEELHDIAVRLFEDAQRESAAGGATAERMLALGIAAGAVLRARAEHESAPPVDSARAREARA